MRLQSLALLLWALSAEASPVAPLSCRATGLASLPQNDNDPQRAKDIATTRAGFNYGPAPLGGQYFPTGAVAQKRINTDQSLLGADATLINNALKSDAQDAQSSIQAQGGFKTMQNYAQQLYANQWKRSIPMGEDEGILSNYTQDLQFGMERLSLNPFPVVRLGPTDTLPFTVDAGTVTKITGSSLAKLQSAGRLFVVDHSNLAKYPAATQYGPRYGGACTAYFYIAASGDFMPLAIKTNKGANLVYTPLDTANDWLLAKLMFNANDQFHTGGFHFASTHSVAEITHEAAVRTLSAKHPIMILLDRLMVGAYAVETIGASAIFNPGGPYDKVFAINSTGFLQFFADSYFAGAGSFKNGYMSQRFQNLLGQSTAGPALKNFPYYEDALKLDNVIRTFMTTFVATYYPTDADIAADTEVQAWFQEATGPAKAIDFPCSFNAGCTRHDLTDILTHFAFLTGVQHHALNAGDLASSAGTLPFHPAALFAPLPTQKGVSDVLPFLPDTGAAINQVLLIGAFNRPQYAAQKRTLMYAYSNATFLANFPASIATAADKYQQSMQDISNQIRAKSFDANGLSQGMPFIYRNLDPAVVPWFLAI